MADKKGGPPDIEEIDLSVGFRRPAAKKTPARKPATKKVAKACPVKPAKKAPGKAVELHVVPDPEPEELAPLEEEPPQAPHPNDLDEEQRSRVGEVFDPALRAYQLRVASMPWDEVRQHCGFRTVSDAQEAVSTVQIRAVAELGATNRAIALQMSVARHEAVVHAWWAKATSKLDPNGAAIVSRELAQLDKVLRVGEIDAQAGQGGPRIVIAGNEEQYVAGLKELWAEQQKPKGLPPARNDTIDG